MNGFRGSGGYGGFNLFPPVLKFLLISNVVIFILQYFIFDMIYFGGYSLNDYFFNYFALHNLSANFSFISTSFWPWQLITFQFMHGGLWHLFFNMFALWMFGTELENTWGSKKFLIFYLLAGIGAGLTQLIISQGPTVGASGGVFGVLLAFGLSFPDRKIFVFPIFIPIKAKYFVMIYAGIELIYGISGTNSGIAHFAHLGGALTGFLLIKYGDKSGIYQTISKWLPFFDSQDKNKSTSNYYNKDYNYQQTKSNKYTSTSSYNKKSSESWDSYEELSNEKYYDIDGEKINQSQIDDILDKISESGYANLTTREKHILNELSKKL